MGFKSGFVTVIGRTNVGKSSIINRIIGEKVSAVANKTQTTRKNVKGILNTDNAQIIFIDTPGIHKPKSKLSNVMIDDAIGSIPDVDVIVYVVDSTTYSIDENTFEKIKAAKKPTILVINKIDLVDANTVADTIEKYKDLYDFKAIIPTSVEKNKNIDEIVKEIENNLEEGPAYYDTEMYTDQNLRELAEETIREKALKLLKDEVPHGILVECTKMKSRKTKENERIYDVEATINCLRESHKGIIIGKGGAMLKKIGSFARQDLEKMFDTKINLKLWVKVKEDWINDSNIIKRFKSED
jgi:GTP-binding protein Era